jgi:hypothetical protein
MPRVQLRGARFSIRRRTHPAANGPYVAEGVAVDRWTFSQTSMIAEVAPEEWGGPSGAAV